MARPHNLRGLAPSVLPVTNRVTLTYCDVGQITSAASGAVTSVQHILGSLYDPDYTYSGHQPYMYDQFAALYTNYKVMRARVVFSFSGRYYNDGPIIVCVTPRLGGDTSTINSMFPALEWPHANSQLVTYDKQFTYDKTFNIWDVLGVPKDRYVDDSVFDAAIGASPAATSFISTVFASVDPTAQPYLVFKVRIEFDAVLSGLKQQTYS